jgi:UDP-glucose 4-epimerase
MGWLTEKHNPETHLIPNLINSTRQNIFKLFGTDWDTPDGTCIRDYVHVVDISNACLTAISNFNQNSHEIINLGSSIGVSVQEVINEYIEIGTKKIFMESLDRRQGDSKILIADSTKAKKFLGWTPKLSLKEIVETMIQAQKEANEN